MLAQVGNKSGTLSIVPKHLFYGPGNIFSVRGSTYQCPNMYFTAPETFFQCAEISSSVPTFISLPRKHFLVAEHLFHCPRKHFFSARTFITLRAEMFTSFYLGNAGVP